jgi:hypothetical protein
MLWLATSSDQYQGCQFCLVVGPNIDLAKKLIKRMRNILRDVLTTTGTDTDTQTAIEINKVWIQAFPSNHLDAYRSLDKPKFIFLDEADFFRKGEQEDVRHVSERYIGKSNPTIAMVSTPNRPDGLMQTIELEEPSIYHKIKLGYEVGLHKIYTDTDIEKAKQSPSFEREYNLKYLGKVGNVFSQTMIDHAIALGEQYKDVPIIQGAHHFGGIDPGYGKTTPIYIAEFDKKTQLIRIIWCKRIEYAAPSEIADIVWQKHTEFLNLHWFIDASSRDLINQIKVQFNESQRWNMPSEVSHHSNHIIPVNFGARPSPDAKKKGAVEGHEMLLEHTHSLISAGYLAIPKQYDKLITSLQTANAIEWDLDKENTVYDDDLDCLRLLLKEVKIN